MELWGVGAEQARRSTRREEREPDQVLLRKKECEPPTGGSEMDEDDRNWVLWLLELDWVLILNRIELLGFSYLTFPILASKWIRLKH